MDGSFVIGCGTMILCSLIHLFIAHGFGSFDRIDILTSSRMVGIVVGMVILVLLLVVIRFHIQLLFVVVRSTRRCRKRTCSSLFSRTGAVAFSLWR